MLRKLIDSVYLGPMPLSGEAFDRWLEEIAREEITDVVCLVPDADIAGLSPDYVVWREFPYYESDGENTSVSVHNLAIRDYGVPEAGDRERFWDLAATVWFRFLKEEGGRIYVHCQAGVGRTGMFAVALLRAAGYSMVRAISAVRAAGSDPETGRQMDFLRQGPPRGLFENYQEYGHDWSPESKAATRDVIDSLDVVAFALNKGCMVQHLSHTHGYISLADAQSGPLVVRSMDTDQEIDSFASVDALITAGWRAS